MDQQRYSQITIGSRKFDAIGNMHLLEGDMLLVHCRRYWTVEEVNGYRNNLVVMARKGAVLVGAFISEKERELLKVAYKEGLDVVRICHYKVTDLHRMSRTEQSHLNNGHLLLLSPWPQRTIKDVLTREICVAMNLIAEDIVMKR